MADKTSQKKAIGIKVVKTGGTGSIWFLGFVGALVYYLHFHSGTFWLVLVAIFKAMFWPAYMVFYLFKSLGM